MDILIAAGIFVAMVLFVEGGYFAFRAVTNTERRRVRMRLNALSFSHNEDETVDILRKRVMSQIPWLNRQLLRISWSGRMNLILEQAAVQYPLGVFVLLSVLLVFAGFLGASLMTSNLLFIVLISAITGTIPFCYIQRRKRKRMQKFERQLPEAVELIARSLKAGHAFTGGLRMVSDELDDPVSTEFYKTLNEINFGLSINDALKNLSDRVDCPDLKFFVISVILQRETGGNLAEILENIGRLIRERFKLFGRVRILSAEGKLSATILVALPFVVALFISVVNPDYIRTLPADPIGKWLIILAIFMMAVGILVIRRMIAIRV